MGANLIEIYYRKYFKNYFNLIKMDDLTKLEMGLEKLSMMFFNSLNEVQRYAPLVNLDNEVSMENSKENLDRIQYEKIENYDENKKNYQSLLEGKSVDINNTFSEIHGAIDNLRSNGDFKKTDEELRKNLKDLKEWNELKIKSINDKVKHIEEIVNNIKKESTSLINMDVFDY